MAVNSRAKGMRGENELAKILTAQGYDCHRTGQTDGRFSADVEGLPGIHIEVKRSQKLNLTAALQQADRDAKHDEIPAVFHRRNREVWQVTMTLDYWLELYEKANK